MERIKNSWPIIFIGFIVLIISVRNYIPGTWLTGWDNLNPEFNFPLNIQRSIFSVWQEYQGLGTIGGLAYGSDLIRQIFLWILNSILPTSLLRYIYTFLMLLLGPLGIYVLLKNIIFKESEGSLTMFGSFLGAAFYLLNLATVQIFFTPFESFTAFYGFLPWSIFSFLYFLKHPNRKNCLIFFIINIFAITQFYVSTIFIVFFISIILIVIGHFMEKRKKSVLKMSSKLLLALFIINAFWLLPFLYFTFTHVNQPAESHMNMMSTEDIYLRNKQYGDLADVILLKGFAFDYVDKDASGNYSYLMLNWREHVDKQYVKFIGFSVFLIMILGFYYAHKKQKPYTWPFSLLFIFSFVMLANDTPPFSLIVEFLRAKSSLFAQIFRVSFTKFGNLVVLSYSIFFAHGILVIISYFNRLMSNRYKVDKFITVIFIFCLGIYILPVFKGELFYYKTRIKIPDDYFSVMDFFNKKETSSRVAMFPQFSYWGWNYYKWGYGGSGFFWYGIKNPTLDRAFDGYRKENENYYWEISNALYSGDLPLFENLLEKYQIEWILFDESIIGSVSTRALNFNKIQEMTGQSTKLSLTTHFGKLKVYHVNLNSNPNDFVFLADNLPMVGPEYRWNNYDKAFADYGSYIAALPNGTPVEHSPLPRPTSLRRGVVSTGQGNLDKGIDVYYPFRSLFTGRQQNELEFEVARLQATGAPATVGQEDTGDYFSFKTAIPKELNGYKLVIPALEEKEVSELDGNDLSQKSIKTPEIYLDGEVIPFASSSADTLDLSYIKEGNLEVRVPKIFGYYSSDIKPITQNIDPKTCDTFNKGLYMHGFVTDTVTGEDLLRLTSVGSSNCLDFDLPSLSQDIGYLVTVQNRNIEGKSLLFSLINKNSQRADIETYLPKSKGKSQNAKIETSYFIIPPMEQFGLGYTLHLDNISIGRVKTVNDLGKITVNPIPYRFLTGLKIINTNFNQQSTINNQQLLSVDHPNPSLYQITINKEQIKDNNTTLVLSQSFDSGWHAYQFSNPKLSTVNYLFPFWTGQEIKDHVLVNNWENGWRLTDNNENIIIVYLPQYLEYIGFILLGAGILIVIFYPKHNLSLRGTHANA